MLNLLHNQGWNITHITDHSWTLMSGSVLLGTLTAFVLCTVFAGTVSEFVYRYHRVMLVMAVLAVVSSMYYFGSISGNGWWYVTVLLFFTALGTWFHRQEIDVIPAVIGFLTIPELSAAIPRLLILYDFL
jgi:lysylphosphatidylglycerol synthetase-like protein (DUF2156 family)